MPKQLDKNSSIDIPNYFDIVPTDDTTVSLMEFRLHRIIIELYHEKRDALEILDGIHERDAKGEFQNVTITKVKEVINKYREETSRFVDENPDFLDKRLDLITRNVQSLEKIERSQWDLYNSLGTDQSKSKVALIGDIKKTVMEKAKLLQLLGNDNDMRKHLEEAKEANHRLVILIKDITSKCPNCKKRLREATGKDLKVIST